MLSCTRWKGIARLSSTTVEDSLAVEADEGAAARLWEDSADLRPQRRALGGVGAAASAAPGADSLVPGGAADGGAARERGLRGWRQRGALYHWCRRERGALGGHDSCRFAAGGLRRGGHKAGGPQCETAGRCQREAGHVCCFRWEQRR